MNGPDPATTDRIIQGWINGRKAGDDFDFVSLYAYNGYYVDTACRFEANGRWDIGVMLRRHLKSADYDAVDPVAVTYTDDGALVQWVWSGTYDGEPFTLEPTTTFEVEDGLIVASIDSYNLADAPNHWSGDCALYPSP